ncbi:MAG: hypothetical protein IH961_08965 [Chloroflexi bacterium]|nr:hypothetical protein [Chloroflexota bacterium]
MEDTMRLQSRWIPVLSLALLGTLIAATAMTGVSYKSTTSFEISGLVGKLLDKAGVDKLSEESFFEGNKMATKNKTSRTIIDLDAETITSVNDLTKTYTVISFDQVAGMFAPGDGQAPEQEPNEEELWHFSFVAADLLLNCTSDMRPRLKTALDSLPRVKGRTTEVLEILEKFDLLDPSANQQAQLTLIESFGMPTHVHVDNFEILRKEIA